MSSAIATFRGLALPWDGAQADGRRFRGWLRICGAIAFLVGTVMPWLPLPEPPPVMETTPAAAPIEISLVEPRHLPPPPPPAPVRARPMQELPPAKTASARSGGSGDSRPGGGTRGATNPAPGNVPDGDPAADARSVAASSGLFAASGALRGLRGAVDQQKLASSGTRATGVGTATTIDRALLRSHHGTRSAGVNEGALSDGTGGVALAGRGTTRVGMPGGAGDGYGGTGSGAGGTGSGTGFGSGTGGSGIGGSGGSGGGTGTGTGQRSIEDIRRVFDANKGAIFAIYHRALRSAPDLRGQVVLELVIAPGGTVTEIRVVSSELADPDLVTRVVSRVRMFDFGAQDVVQTRISYPVHFLPG